MEEPTANNQAQQPVIPAPAANTFGPQVDATPAFWIYFPEARHIFVNKEVVNRHNDATGLSYDDIFIKQLFSSYIIKHSNSEDLHIRDDLDRLLESQRIKKVLMNLNSIINSI